MSLIAGILSKELTSIPEIFSKYFGRFYSNALCNGCTWLFIIWYILHSGLDYALNELFRKMRYKEYHRIRLKHSLWYLGFFCTASLYTGATLFQNRVDVLGFRKIHYTAYNDVSSDLVIGFMLIFTFFLHSAFWEVMEYDDKTAFASYILLSAVLLVSFFLRILEVAFTLIAFVSITQVVIESAKLLYVVTKTDSLYLRFISSVFFGLSICSFAVGYLIGVPLIFLIPFGRKLIFAHLPAGYIPFTVLLSCWYVSEISNSPLFKLVNHWLFHTEKTSECCGNIVECSLFPPRTDVAYNIQQLRKEIKERQERLLALKKQTKKGILMQTIKCMVNLKRKIHARRASTDKSPEKDSEDSSDFGEYSNEEKRDETKKLISDHSPEDIDDSIDKDVKMELFDIIKKVSNIVEQKDNETNEDKVSSSLLDGSTLDSIETNEEKHNESSYFCDCRDNLTDKHPYENFSENVGNHIDELDINMIDKQAIINDDEEKEVTSKVSKETETNEFATGCNFMNSNENEADH